MHPPGKIAHPKAASVQAHAGKHPAHVRPNPPIGVLDLHKMSKMFYHAAWWMAEAESSHFVRESPYSDDWASRMVGFFDRSQLLSVEDNPVQVSHRADAMSAHMTKHFLDLLHHRGGAAAQVYASTMHARQIHAQRQVMDLYRRADVNNAAIAHRAGEAAYALSYVIVGCEVALAVGVCALSLGAAGVAAPVFLAGITPAAAQGWALGIPVAYSFASHAIKEDPVHEKATGFAISFGKFTAVKAPEMLMEHGKKVAEAKVVLRTETFKQASARVAELNIKLARDNNVFSKGMHTVQRAFAGHTVNRSAAQIAHLEKVKSFMHGGTVVLPIVAAGLELKEAFEHWRERQEELER